MQGGGEKCGVKTSRHEGEMSEEGKEERVTHFDPLPNESWIPSVIQGLFFSRLPITDVILTPHRSTFFHLLFRH